MSYREVKPGLVMNELTKEIRKLSDLRPSEVCTPHRILLNAEHMKKLQAFADVRGMTPEACVYRWIEALQIKPDPSW